MAWAFFKQQNKAGHAPFLVNNNYSIDFEGLSPEWDKTLMLL